MNNNPRMTLLQVESIIKRAYNTKDAKEKNNLLEQALATIENYYAAVSKAACNRG